MTVQQVVVIARVAARHEHADAYLLARTRKEHGCNRITTDLRVCQHVREVKVTSLFKWRIGREAHAFPQRLCAIVDALLTSVFRIFFLSQMRNGDAEIRRSFTEKAVEAQIDVTLEHRHEFTERSSIRPVDIDLRARSTRVAPGAALRLDDQSADRSLVGMLDGIGRRKIARAKLD